jgi:ribonucleoside-diphosphate reductase beta chain
MFFGEEAGIARYDRMKYPIFDKIKRTMKSFYWDPEEINLTKDDADFKMMQEHERHIFTKNIAYQVLLDSVQERAPLVALIPWISLPELEGCVIWWAAFENIHAQSYQWILQNLYNDPSEVFDSILKDSNIVQRAAAIVRYYDDFINYGNLYKALGPGYHEVATAEDGCDIDRKTYNLTKRELKKKLLLALISIYALESIRFYVSFACSFAFGQQGKMIGNADIIKFIAKDESQHVGIPLNIIRNYLRREGDDEMISIFNEIEDEIYAIFDEVVNQEKEWATYLFKDGSIIGLNETLLAQYLEHIANKRLKSLGLKERYQHKDNPFSWLSSWLDAESNQTAPQEKDLTDYAINALDTSVNEDNLLDF